VTSNTNSVCASRRRSARPPPSTGRLANTSKPLAALLDTETLPALQRKVEEADGSLREFQEETGFADFEEQYASLLDGRRKLTSQLSEIRLKKVRFQSERDALNEINSDNLVGLFDPALAGTRALL